MNKITCFMLYYGRKDVAEQSMESFLRQTYPYKKLLIINTHPDPVWFEKEYPDVEVHNIIPDTFKNLNEKYAYALSRVKTNWWAPWDSDDIWLPWHLENLAAYISKVPQKRLPRKIGHPRSYFMLGKRNQIRIGWQMWGTSIWETFDRNGKLYATCNPEIVENCDRQITFQKWNRYWLDTDENPISFIFRWRRPIDENRSYKLGQEGVVREKQLRDKMNKVSLKESWRPHWAVDYIKLTRGEHAIVPSKLK